MSMRHSILGQRPHHGAIHSIASARVAPSVCVAPARCLVLTSAKRREVDTQGFLFQDVFLASAERVYETKGFLKKTETQVLLASIKSSEQAYKTLELFAQHIKNRRENESDKNDWPFRKKYYTSLCLSALNMGAPEVIYALMKDIPRYDIKGSYYAQELIVELAAAGASADIINKVAELFRLQKPVGDKGARAALLAAVDALESKGGDGLTAAKEALNGFKAAAAAAKAAAAAAAPVAEAPVQAPQPVMAL